MIGSPHSPVHQPTVGSPRWNMELMSAQQQFQRCNMVIKSFLLLPFLICCLKFRIRIFVSLFCIPLCFFFALFHLLLCLCFFIIFKRFFGFLNTFWPNVQWHTFIKELFAKSIWKQKILGSKLNYLLSKSTIFGSLVCQEI